MLTIVQIKNAKPPTDRKFYKMYDGQNLYLRINKTGSKIWYFRYEIDGDEKLLSLGKFPGLNMSDARKKAREMHAMVLDGIDPSLVRKSNRKTNLDTFESVARAWHKERKSTSTRRPWSKNHARVIIRRLEMYVFPQIGKIPIKKLTALELEKCLENISNQGKKETAVRIKSICHFIYKYAIKNELVKYDHTQVIDVTPPEKRNFPTILEPKKIGQLMRDIDTYIGTFISRQALKLAPLVFLRPGELRAGEWSEIDWEKKIWLLPPEKMKKKREHIVPLSTQSIKVLKETYELSGRGKYIFPARGQYGKYMSENTILYALRRMGYGKDEIVTHGFRHMASTILNENGWDDTAIELQLSHVKQGKIKRIYDKSKLLPTRTKMMQWWADYLDELKNLV